MVATTPGLNSYPSADQRSVSKQQRREQLIIERYTNQIGKEEYYDPDDVVAIYEAYVKLIQSLHKSASEQIKWEEIKAIPKPMAPIKYTLDEDDIQYDIDNYAPSALARFFGFAQKRIKLLNEALAHAQQKNQQKFDKDQLDFTNNIFQWELLQKMARGVVEKNAPVYPKILKYFAPLSEINQLGSSYTYRTEDHQGDLDLLVNSEALLPKQELKLTATGKLSKRNLTKTKSNELYQDHICSCVLRVAREIFAYLPIDSIRINAISKILNTATGHLEDQPILSAIITRQTINSLNLNGIDPSDSMKNFIHQMKFSKTNGFSAVDKVQLK